MHAHPPNAKLKVWQAAASASWRATHNRLHGCAQIAYRLHQHKRAGGHGVRCVHQQHDQVPSSCRTPGLWLALSIQSGLLHADQEARLLLQRGLVCGHGAHGIRV